MSETAGELVARAEQARRETDRSEAHRLFSDAVSVAKSAADPETLIRALRGLAEVERGLGRGQDAVTHYEEAVAQCRAADA